MNYNLFISYPDTSRDIVENLRDQFKKFGINAWVYSIDQTLNLNPWKEIEEKISASDLVVFIVSERTPAATGQHQELELATQKIGTISNTDKIMPIFIVGASPSSAPELLKHKNGPFLHSGNVKSVALKITKRVFPSLLKTEDERPWKYPIPGEWLKVTNLDDNISEDFDLGDKLYFRRVSPMGLFECYAPKIEGAFWILPENVRLSYDTDEDKALESQMPSEFKYWNN
ncbi:MAG: hypothetical protein A3E85_03090 [Gammaproteobacteria bacterium RIFCSPHIGHO2_12_FULL_45_12]|nr:MAG: hypothetical protein A3E85_03090 [Gammaproteobacteria bacterium RIFCSPHIGHO2_12_FULL_45_12]